MILFCGLFKNIVLLAMLIIPHELGHAVMGQLCGFKVREVRLCPYGGNTVFEGCYNSSLKEEWMVLLAGPMMQMVSFIFLSFFLSVDDVQILKTYHVALLAFNWLPFYPLDGGKALQLFCSFFMPYYTSLLFTLLFSSLGLSILILISFWYHFYQLCFVFLIIFFKCLNTFHKRRYLMQSYLLVRYLHPRWFFRKRIVSSPYQFYFGCRNIICINQMEWTENSFLKQYFHRKKL